METTLEKITRLTGLLTRTIPAAGDPQTLNDSWALARDLVKDLQHQISAQALEVDNNTSIRAELEAEIRQLKKAAADRRLQERKKIWSEAWVAVASCFNSERHHAKRWADQALTDFEDRFPE